MTSKAPTSDCAASVRSSIPYNGATRVAGSDQGAVCPPRKLHEVSILNSMITRDQGTSEIQRVVIARSLLAD